MQDRREWIGEEPIYVPFWVSDRCSNSFRCFNPFPLNPNSINPFLYTGRSSFISLYSSLYPKQTEGYSIQKHTFRYRHEIAGSFFIYLAIVIMVGGQLLLFTYSQWVTTTSSVSGSSLLHRCTWRGKGIHVWDWDGFLKCPPTIHYYSSLELALVQSSRPEIKYFSLHEFEWYKW